MSTSTQPAQTGTGYPAPPETGRRGRAFTIAGGICAAVALFFIPIIFGPVGAIFGFVGYGRGDRKGLWVGIAAIIATFVGLLLAALVFKAQHS